MKKICTVVGARPQFIKLAVETSFDPAYRPFGDGHSAERIVERIGKFPL